VTGSRRGRGGPGVKENIRVAGGRRAAGVMGQRRSPNHPLQQTAAAVSVSGSSSLTEAAAAAELGRSAKSSLMTPEDAKQRSEQQLRQLGVRINPNLPLVEGPSELSPRDAQEVMSRAFVLSYVIGVGHGRPGTEMLERVRKAGLESVLTLQEQEWLAAKRLGPQTRAEVAWFVESVQACAWALGLVELHPLKHAPDELADHFLSPAIDPAARIRGARLRPNEELYAQADLFYRLHWAARQAQLDRTPFPQPEISVRMRRRALDWIIGVPYEWDEVPTDT
jgi:Domain of unknown function (DUF4272)